MKNDWRKLETNFYLPKKEPALITIPEYKFFTLQGKGDPNGTDFSERVGVLYSLAYAIKMLPKKGVIPEGYEDYSVYPLEGIWSMTEEGIKAGKLLKEELLYTIMIRQPEFVTEPLALEMIEIVKKKKPHRLLDEVLFQSITDGKCVQMLHTGPFDNEPESFLLMKQYCDQNQLIRSSMLHREIYITDARKTQPEKRKTVLRFKVE